MTYNELFELEMQLANSGIKSDQFNTEEGVQLRNLIGDTKYGIWDSFIAKGKWIIITTRSKYEANRTFQNLLDNFPMITKENALLLIQNKDEEYKICIQVNETE